MATEILYIQYIDGRERVEMKIIFVYNADSGFINTVMDIGHKIISPETYNCNLCGLTFGNFKENSRWKEFREETSVEMEFLHRDEFERKYKKDFNYPVILKEVDGILEIAISKGELENFKDIEKLIEAVSKI